MSSLPFQMPRKVSIEQLDPCRGVFVFEPLEKGYGVTMGNTLRRVLLSSLEGYAITAIKIPGVQHEFSTIKGVVEDVVELVLNLKQVRLKKVADHVGDLISVKLGKQAQFTAGDIMKCTSAFEVMDPDFVICNLDGKEGLEMELRIGKGRGYVPSEENKEEGDAIGMVAIDAIFTPVKSVQYHIDNTRVEQKIDYEKLTLEVVTDGSLSPQEALQQASSIMIKHFTLSADESHMARSSDHSSDEGSEDQSALQMKKLLNTPLSETGLSVRAYNCLRAVSIYTLGDLANTRMEELAKVRNFGKKSLTELEELMKSKGLSLGADRVTE